MNTDDMKAQLALAENLLGSIDLEKLQAVAAIAARQQKILFDSYKSAGFTDEQALDLASKIFK